MIYILCKVLYNHVMNLLKTFLKSALSLGLLGLSTNALAQTGETRIIIEPISGNNTVMPSTTSERIAVPGSWALDNVPAAISDEQSCASYYIQHMAESGNRNTLVNYLYLLQENGGFNSITNLDKLRITKRLSAENIILPDILKTALYNAIDLPPAMQLKWIEVNEKYVQAIINDPEIMAYAENWQGLLDEMEASGDTTPLKNIAQKAVNIRAEIFGAEAPDVEIAYQDLTSAKNIIGGFYDAVAHKITLNYDHTHKLHNIYDFIKTMQLIGHEHDHAIEYVTAMHAESYTGEQAIMASLFHEAYYNKWHSNDDAKYYTYRASILERVAFQSEQYIGNMLNEYMVDGSTKRSLFSQGLEKSFLKTQQEQRNNYRVSLSKRPVYKPLICSAPKTL